MQEGLLIGLRGEVIDIERWREVSCKGNPRGNQPCRRESGLVVGHRRGNGVDPSGHMGRKELLVVG
jgi:hypothetical protein